MESWWSHRAHYNPLSRADRATLVSRVPEICRKDVKEFVTPGFIRLGWQGFCCLRAWMPAQASSDQRYASLKERGWKPFFESNPWLLIPIIILTVEGWTAFKRAVVAWRDKERLRSKAP